MRSGQPLSCLTAFASNYGVRDMPMNVNPIPTVDQRINEIRELTAKIVNKEILPQERALAARWRRDASAEEKSASRAVADSIKDKVKKAGLWADRKSVV